MHTHSYRAKAKQEQVLAETFVGACPPLNGNILLKSVSLFFKAPMGFSIGVLRTFGRGGRRRRSEDFKF